MSTDDYDRMAAIGQRLLARFGIKVEDRMPSPERPYSWDGRAFASHDSAGNKLGPEWTLHDVSHWRIASPTRRKRPEFGLGVAPNGWRPHDLRRRVADRTANVEELAASMIDAALRLEIDAGEALKWLGGAWSGDMTIGWSGSRALCVFTKHGIRRLGWCMARMRLHAKLDAEEKRSMARLFDHFALDASLRRELLSRLA